MNAPQLPDPVRMVGLLAPNFYLHSITAMPDTSPIVHTMLTIKFKSPCIG